MTSARLEAVYPFLGGAFTGLAIYIAVTRGLLDIPAQVQQLYSTGIDVGAIALGFLATAQTVLIAVEDRKPIAMLKESGHFERLVNYTFQAIWLCFATIVASAVTYILPIDDDRIGVRFFALWSMIAVMTGFACLRVFRIYRVVLRPAKRP